MRPGSDFFDTIDTEYKMYWYGFLAATSAVEVYADGGKQRPMLSVDFCTADKEHVCRLARTLRVRPRITTDGASSTLSIKRTAICNALSVAVAGVPWRHFWRGAFDGCGQVDGQHLSIVFKSRAGQMIPGQQLATDYCEFMSAHGTCADLQPASGGWKCTASGDEARAVAAVLYRNSSIDNMRVRRELHAASLI